MTRICRVPYSGNDTQGRDFHLPVFVFVFTKFRKMPNAKMVRCNDILHVYVLFLSHNSLFLVRKSLFFCLDYGLCDGYCARCYFIGSVPGLHFLDIGALVF